MKLILQVFDMAGVASLTSRILNDSGFKSVTLYREKDDPYQISEYYSSKKISNNPVLMLIQLIVILLQLRPKIVVVHYHQIMVIPIKLICLLIGCRTKIIMQYHGSDMRLHGMKPWILPLCHGTIGVTWDVVPQGGVLLENAIDEELFYPEHNLRNSQKALFFKSKPLDCSWLANWYAKVFALHLDDWGGVEGFLRYRYMGVLLRQYAFYFDMKGLDALSKTACEALACGAIVLNEHGKWTYPLDVNNDLKIEKIVDYYETTLLSCK